MPYWLDRDMAEWRRRRADYPKQDLEFRDARERKKRICHTVRQAEPFFDYYIEEANAALARGEPYPLAVDPENAPKTNKYNWYEQELWLGGATEAEVKKRVGKIELLREEMKNKRPYHKIAYYWEYIERETTRDGNF